MTTTQRLILNLKNLNNPPEATAPQPDATRNEVLNTLNDLFKDFKNQQAPQTTSEASEDGSTLNEL